MSDLTPEQRKRQADPNYAHDGNPPYAVSVYPEADRLAEHHRRVRQSESMFEMRESVEELLAALSVLEGQLADTREALRFYGDMDNWDTDRVENIHGAEFGTSPVERDNGERAREALRGAEGPNEGASKAGGSGGGVH
jgi:hypothetical protein